MSPFFKNRALCPRGLYAILDRSLVADDDWEAAAKAVLNGGADVLQLRLKDEPVRRTLELARMLKKLCDEAGALFVVNDRAAVARAAGAALHVGQEDIPLDMVRPSVGEDAVMGVSTHSLSQAIYAEEAGADYIGFGPIYSTSTKPDALTPRGIDSLEEIVNKVEIPVVAIGGIGLDNMGDIRAAGAACAAVISALGKGGQLEENARALVAAWEDARK